MNLRQFERVVADALEELPEAFQDLLENVVVMVQNVPTREQMIANDIHGRYDIFGLYEGVPLTERDSGYGMVQPDRITLFKLPLEAAFQDEADLRMEIRKTVVHEVAHHFGIDDDRLEALGY